MNHRIKPGIAYELLVVIEAVDLTDFSNDYSGCILANTWNRQQPSGCWRFQNLLFDFLFNGFDLFVVGVDHREVCLNDRLIGITEREFLVELSPSRTKQLAVVGVVRAREDCSDAVFLSSPRFDKRLARPDEIPQCADLVRWDLTLSEHIRPEHLSKLFGVDAIGLGRRVGDNPVL